MDILALIPARSGSKSVVDKNIRPIAGKPMLAYSIEHAAASKYITRTIVSTDSEKYAAIAREYGAEVPFIRPAELATDTALDVDVFYHALTFLKEKEGYIPRLVVQLRPTYPIRKISDIDTMIERMLADDTIDSMRCIAPAKEIPHKMWYLSDDGITITPVINDPPECYNMPRQQLKKAYYQNACIDVVRPSVILDQHSMSGIKVAGYIMEENYDIDTPEEFARAEAKILSMSNRI
ncbi:MAG: acylneuraminate cytidylyltransferase family protein [Lachnospiraceae bacterium]|nr:acylneuraminate cytidylyltransferase family protein [Lachnospiraceae bacterium]